MTITAATAATLRYEPIPVAYLDHVRTAGLDEAGNPLVVRVEDEGGHPLRCCLRDSRPGERVLLIAYTPPGGAGPYAERGPVFVHADACDGYADVDVYPPGLRHRRQVVRAYDTHADMGDGVLVDDGAEAERAVAELLARPEVEVVHVRNVVAGCYNFCVRRTPASDQ